jgi:hypothetical protein
MNWKSVLLGFTAVLLTTISPSSLQGQVMNEVVAEYDKSIWPINHDLFVFHAIPKCGTHFAARLISLMTHKDLCGGPLSLKNFQAISKANQCLHLLIPFTLKAQNIINHLHHKVVSIVRDPRDALISHVFYMRTFAKNPGKPLKRDFFIVGKDFDHLTLEQQITSLIVGNEHAPSYIDFYLQRVGWCKQPSNLMLKYEDLIGFKGGGDDDIQKENIKNLAAYINLPLSEEKLQDIMDNLYIDFGEVHVEDKIFKRSTTHNWRKFLTPEQIDLLKPKIGDILILLGYEKDLDW